MARLSLHVPNIKQLAVPSVCLLIIFLSYSSQYLFYFIDPGPLTRKESIWFNLLVSGIWISYERACRVDPGRLPKRFAEASEDDLVTRDARGRVNAGEIKGNWCWKCNAVKPVRSHHCRQCGRCIPKMDHHCPWTSNCVSYTTFPHFLRFILYAIVSMAVLEYHLWNRAYALYEQRNLPSYLGPSIAALTHLLILIGLNSMMLFALTILFVTATRSLLINTTMIEAWEIERHETLVERARYLGGFVKGPGGQRIRIQKQEFPYDIGFWNNVVQGMGTANILAWLLPFGGGPDNEAGWEFEENGFEDPDVLWPPPDPDKMPRAQKKVELEDPFVHGSHTSMDDVAAFKIRQQNDFKRFQRISSPRATGVYQDEDEYMSEEEFGMDGEQGWTNSDGDRLRDYGVDEEAVVDADDIPLGELLRRRRIATKAQA